MTKDELKLRFSEHMAAAGFQTMMQLASQIVLNIPQGATWPMAKKEVTNTANAIRALVSGERKAINLTSEFSGLAQEVATLLHVAPEMLFETDVPLDHANVYEDMVKPQVTGQDQDKALIARDILALQSRFTPEDWDILNRIYVQGETNAEIAKALGCPASHVKVSADRVNTKLRRATKVEPFEDYSNDPHEYFYAADYREIAAHNPTTAGGEFFRVAYRAGANPTIPALQTELARAQNHLMRSSYVANNIVSPYFDVKAAELMDILGGFAYMPQTPNLKMVNAFQNTLAYISEAMPSDYKMMMREMARRIAERLEGGNETVPPYRTSHMDDAMAIHSAMKGIDELLSLRSPLRLDAFTLR